MRKGVNHGRSRYPTKASGFSIIELLIVVSLLGVLLVLGLRFLPDDSARIADNFAQLFRQARFEAIKHETPVAVVWDEANRELKVIANVSNCDGAGDTVRVLNISDRRVREVTVGLPGNGIIWLPSNFARTCDNTMFFGTSSENQIIIEGRRSSYGIRITSAGLVEVM